MVGRELVDVMLINSPVRNPLADAHARGAPPLGLGYIGAVLEENDIEVSAIDMNIPAVDVRDRLSVIGFEIDHSFERLEGQIGRGRPVIVGISAYTETYTNALRIARTAKEVDPSVVTVVGGPHVTFRDREAVEDPYVDVVVRREGEFTVFELAKHFLEGGVDLDDVLGITFQRDGRVVSTPPRPFLEDLDALPFPARDLFPIYEYQFPGSILTARGCPGRCIFCAAGAMSGNRYRMRTPVNVLEELQDLHGRYGLEFFVFVDDTFTVYPNRTHEICKMIEESGLDIRWGCSTRANTVTHMTLEGMAKAGCVEIQFGVESGSDRILRSIRKGITVEDVRKAVGWARELGMDVVCSFMLPHPEDEEGTLMETKRFIDELLRLGAGVTIAYTTPFPGTFLFENMEELGLTLKTSDWSDFDCSTPILETRNMSIERLRHLFSDLITLRPQPSSRPPQGGDMARGI